MRPMIAPKPRLGCVCDLCGDAYISDSWTQPFHCILCTRGNTPQLTLHAMEQLLARQLNHWLTGTAA